VQRRHAELVFTENQIGFFSTIVINTRTMRECGFGYGAGKNGLSLSDVGALARSAGFYDVKRFLGPRVKGA
jgi:hypothetical protein